MTEDRTNAGGEAATAEPALTQKNSQTIRGEELLADDVGGVELNVDGYSGTRPKAANASAPVYGAAGDTTDAYEGGDDQEDVRGSET